MKIERSNALQERLEQLSGSGRSRAEQFAAFWKVSGDGGAMDGLAEKISGDTSSRTSLLLYLIVTGAYPAEQVFRRVEEIGREFGWDRAIDWIQSCTEVTDNKIEFASSGIAYDVTNTLISPVLTGIQRVVYELGRGIWEAKDRVYFFTIKAGIGPVLLSEENTAAFLEKYKPSSRSLTDSVGEFNPYDLLDSSGEVANRGRAGSWKLSLRSKAKSAYEFGKIYVFSPAMTVGIAAQLARLRSYRQKKYEEAAIPKLANSSRSGIRGRIAGLFARGHDGDRQNSVVWFDDCNLLVAELFSPMRSDMYPAFLAGFKSTTMLIHDVIPISHPQYCVDSVVAAHVGYLRVTAMFDRVVTVSRSTGRSYSDFVKPTYGKSPQVDPVLLPNFQGELPPRQLDGAAIPRVCCFSTMEPRKGHWRVVEACEQLWASGLEFELILIGGTGWKSEELVERINFLRGKRRPIYRNRRFLDDHEVGLLMRECLCSVFCSEVEGFGLPVVESLALGVPVICSNISSMAEIVELTEGCVPVDPFALDEIAAAIRKFVEGGFPKGEQKKISLDGLLTAEEFVEEVARFPG